MSRQVEYRINPTEFRFNEEDNFIEGRAIPFNVLSPNREGFREKIAPSAINPEIIAKSDIFMLYNHNQEQGFLARKKNNRGSLKIEIREDGVWFKFKPKKDNLSQYIVERLKDEELSETSWAFTLAEDEWVLADDGIYERTITKFDKLYDFSIVDNSYYGIEDVVGCARFAEIKEEERLRNEQKLKELKEQREAELNKYFLELRSQYLG